jgi:hypothetical protein
MITKSCGRVVEILAGALDEREREAVLGDLLESGQSGRRAALGVCGLVVRHEAALWSEWHPWVVLAGLIIPFSILISVLSKMVAGETATYAWMYLNNWDWGLLRNDGFWYELASAGFVVLRMYFTVACWSWVVGFAVSFASRRGVRANGILLCFMLLLGEAVGAPLYLAYFFRAVHLPVAAHSNDPVFALTFYRVMFPLMVQIALVVLPSLLGMREGARAKERGTVTRGVLVLALIIALTVMVIQSPGFLFLVKAYERPWIWRSWEMQMLPLIAYWPVVYMFGSAIARKLHKKSVIVETQ